MNIQTNAFQYEYTVRKKQTEEQNLNYNSTPSLLSEQSIDDNPEEESKYFLFHFLNLLKNCKSKRRKHE